MSETIRISDEVAQTLHKLGGTFDDPDDVLRRVLEQAGYEVPDEETIEWDKSDLRSYFESTSATKQQIFLRALVDHDEEWVPKRVVFDRYEANGITPQSHTMDGVQSGMSRRCGNREKFWESASRDGERQYRILPRYREVVEDYWGT